MSSSLGGDSTAAVECSDLKHGASVWTRASAWKGAISKGSSGSCNYAAAGPDQLEYPWGNDWRPDVCNDGTHAGTTPVTAFPAGRSPFGCYDLCGNMWHWTESERTDGRTRFCILKGGSWYRADGSHWYADGGPQPSRFAAKFLLMWPGLDRCATIGFRCVTDLALRITPAQGLNT